MFLISIKYPFIRRIEISYATQIQHNVFLRCSYIHNIYHKKILEISISNMKWELTLF